MVTIIPRRGIHTLRNFHVQSVKLPYTSIGSKIVGQGELDQQEAVHFHSPLPRQLFNQSFLILKFRHSKLFTWENGASLQCHA